MLKPVYFAFVKTMLEYFLQTTHFVKSRAHSPRPTSKNNRYDSFDEGKPCGEPPCTSLVQRSRMLMQKRPLLPFRTCGREQKQRHHYPTIPCGPCSSNSRLFPAYRRYISTVSTFLNKRASERRSREGPAKGELATFSFKFSFVLRPDEGKYHWLKNDVPEIKVD